jgi:hypothetical protein
MKQIVLEIHDIIESRNVLLLKAKTSELSPHEHSCLIDAETKYHQFCKMCRGGYAPLNPMIYGVQWGERIVHESSPECFGFVREEGLIEYQGKVLSLMEATRLIAQTAKTPTALGGWKTSLGRLGDLAGLNPVVIENQPVTIEVFKSSETEAVLPEVLLPESKKKKEPQIGQNYDLFG